MLTNATTTPALQMRCVKITLDHLPAHATMATLEMDSHAEVRFPITSVIESTKTAMVHASK